MAAVDLCLVPAREPVAERRAEVLPAVSSVRDPDLGPVGEVLVVAARAEDVAHPSLAVQHAIGERPLAVAPRVARDDALLGDRLLDARAGPLGGDRPVLEGPGVEDRHPPVLRLGHRRRGAQQHRRENPSMSHAHRRRSSGLHQGGE